MKCLRLFADDNGESHFEETDVELSPMDYAPPAPALDVSAPVDAARYVFVRFPAGWDGDWHVSPRRQVFVIMSGEVEGTTSDGTVRTLGPGQALVMEDTHGKGHRARAISPEGVTAIIIHLE